MLTDPQVVGMPSFLEGQMVFSHQTLCKKVFVMFLDTQGCIPILFLYTFPLTDKQYPMGRPLEQTDVESQKINSPRKNKIWLDNPKTEEDLSFWLHQVLVVACGITVPWPWIEPVPPALAVQNPNHMDHQGSPWRGSYSKENKQNNSQTQGSQQNIRAQFSKNLPPSHGQDGTSNI